MLHYVAMFGKIKNFAMRKMLEKQLKDAPPEQRDMILGLLEKNPELFEKLAKEMQDEMKKMAITRWLRP